MYLFDDNVVRQKGENLFFDLDIIIQKNIDDIANFDPEDCLCFGQTHWHDLETMQKDRISLDTIIADQDTSMIISGMNARIKMLEDKILDVESRKDYE